MIQEPLHGTVVSIRSVLCHVDTGSAVYTCQARRRLVDSDTGQSKPIAVGDRVVITPSSPSEGVVERVLPRTTRLSRTSPRDHRKEQVIVANVDQLLIVASVRRPPLRLGLIDRYIIAGDSGGIPPVLCINKVDLAEDESEYADAIEMYTSMEYDVLTTSAETGEGIGALRDLLRGKTTVLAGHSGVGKSSLINAVQPGMELRTGDVYLSGRHTTTWASLLKLEVGGYVVDTPGIREFTLWDIKPAEVAQFFPQIWELSHDCHMPDCSHDHEPGCAVKDAVDDESLPWERYDSYMRILETLEEESIPRSTDVDKPEEQIAKKKRKRGSDGTRSRTQSLHQLLDDYGEDEDEDMY
jgi:ribosome biogenesis GTPase / thiamine phosphate phosphatase